MELELGLKITRTRDDITSLSDLRISKDRNGPVFVSREIDTMFVLIAHLKDYRGENIDIRISEDGSRIAITGAKPVEEMVLKRWIMWNKKLELRTFKKTFRVPDGVVLDKIKAKFKEEDSTLTITMPKLVKGIVGGAAIEEVKVEEVDRGEPETSSNIVPEPETTSVQESKEAQQVVEIKPEIAQTTTGESPEEESDKGETAAAIEDGIIEEETNEIGEVSVDKGESDATENVPQEMPERLGQMVEETPQETQEIEDQMEVKESTPEKVEEPSASIALEPKEVQPERETQEAETTMPPPVEEPQAEEIPELKEETPETPETETKAGSELSETGVEEHTTNEKSQIESSVIEEIEKQEAGVGDEDPIKPEPDQEEQAENKEQVPEQETDQARNEIQESVDEEARLTEEEERNESVNPEVEKQIDSSEGAIQENTKKKKKKKPKLCPPLVVAGSAFLVTLIVLVISLIRSKKR